MTGWGAFWNVYCRGTVMPVQKAKDLQKRRTSRLQGLYGYVGATKPEYLKLTGDKKAWMNNKFDDINGCLLLPSLSIYLLFSHLDWYVPCSIMQLLAAISFWCES
jgi:hypothetical protein